MHMVHPMLKMLATRPELMAEHLGAYAELAAAEATEAAALWRGRLLWAVGTGAFVLLALMFGGISLLLLGALPRESMPAPWLLALVPLLALALAAACWLTLRSRPAAAPFAQLRQQVEVDAALLREAGES
jgi:uncharacterized membrane protein YqjE